MSSDNVKELAGKLTHAEAEQTAIRVGIEALTERVDKKSSSQYNIYLNYKKLFVAKKDNLKSNRTRPLTF